MTEFELAAATYAPALTYLTVVSMLLWRRGRVPGWVHGAGLGLGLLARLTLTVHAGSPVTAAALPVLAAAGVFAVGVLVGGRLLTGASLFTMVVALSLLPFEGWAGVLMGLLAAALVATVRTWRALGKIRVATLTLDTLSVVGLTPAGLRPPTPDRLMAREDAVDVHEATALARRMRIYLAPYLLAGAGLALALSLR